MESNDFCVSQENLYNYLYLQNPKRSDPNADAGSVCFRLKLHMSIYPPARVGTAEVLETLMAQYNYIGLIVLFLLLVVVGS